METPQHAHEMQSAHASTDISAESDRQSLAACKDKDEELDESPNDSHATPYAFPRSPRIGIMVLVAITQLVQMFPYGTGITGGLTIAAALHYKQPQYPLAAILPQDSARITADAVWIAASYPLMSGTFVLIGGRLGEVFGHRLTMGIGSAWWVVWSFATGYTDNLVGLCIVRGLTGIGGGILVPNAVAMLGVTFPPSKRRNVAMGLFGAGAPVGAAGGSMIASLFLQLTPWRWVMFFSGIIGAVIFTLAFLMLDPDEKADPKGQIDWVGAYLGVAGLILFNFCWNQAPSVGWQEPYIYALLIVSILHLAGFVVWESRVATSPILPFDIWEAKSFGLLLVLVFFSFMSLGIFIWYFTLIGTNIRGCTIIESAANYQPLAVGGTTAAFLAAWLVSRIPAQWILATGNLCLVIISTLLATTPKHQTYWAMMFPAAFLASFTVDLIFASSQIIASASVSRKRQGVAGSLISTLLTYGLSTGLGFAGTVEAYTNKGGTDLLSGYRHALYLAIGFGGFPLLVALFYLRVPPNKQQGWGDKTEAAAQTRDEV